jgi:Ca2+/Na+ antiporter
MFLSQASENQPPVVAIPANEAAAAAAEEANANSRGGGAHPSGGGQKGNDHLPWCYPLFVVGAFGSSVVWLHLIAGELVALMEAAGIALGVSTALLGLTVLAWGNSVGDLISDTTVARAGQVQMAVSACFGSPLLTTLLGLGLALTVTTTQTYPVPFLIGPPRSSLIFGWCFLMTRFDFLYS